MKEKIIDYKFSGNTIRFYLGDAALKEYYGDDWNDYPYECNAGIVYDKYISSIVDVAFSLDYEVYDPATGIYNDDSGFCKADLATGRYACLIVVSKEDGYWSSYRDVAAAKNSIRFYYNDPAEKIFELEKTIPGFKIIDIKKTHTTEATAEEK